MGYWIGGALSDRYVSGVVVLAANAQKPTDAAGRFDFPSPSCGLPMSMTRPKSGAKSPGKDGDSRRSNRGTPPISISD